MNENEYFGSSYIKEDLDGDNLLDTIIGAPGWGKMGYPLLGKVYIQFGNGKNTTIEGDVSSNRCGHSITVLDFDLDGK